MPQKTCTKLLQVTVMASILHWVADFSQLCGLQIPGASQLSPFASIWKITGLPLARFEFPAWTIIALFREGKVGSACYHSRREGDKEGPLCVTLKRKACSYFFRQFFKNRKILCFTSQIRNDWRKKQALLVIHRVIFKCSDMKTVTIEDIWGYLF